MDPDVYRFSRRSPLTLRGVVHFPYSGLRGLDEDAEMGEVLGWSALDAAGEDVAGGCADQGGDECWLCAGKAVLWRLVLVWQFLGGRLWRLGWARSIGGQVTLVPPRVGRVGEPQDEQNLMRGV